MKRIIALAVCIICIIAFSAMTIQAPEQTVEEPEVTAHIQPIIADTMAAVVETTTEPEPVIEEYIDYMHLMILACIDGDYEYGRWVCEMRNQKIDFIIEQDGECQYNKIDFDELMLLAKIMHAEAGGALWLPDDWVMCVGEVVLNRVASTEFPNTISEVIYQKGQYYGSGSTYFNNLTPNERTVLVAVRLLEGERYMNKPSVVFQAEFIQGSGTYIKFTDSKLGTTYFCISSYPNIYE